MKILTPLGLLGLLGILVLILIYIIKPNYQQKYISSTYVWKLSLKYKKKKIPTSRLRDLLLILCQILAITCCAMLLATPSQVLRQQPEEGEVIVIVDASASMRATTDDETRFIRAVRQASELSDKILKENGFGNTCKRQPRFPQQESFKYRGGQRQRYFRRSYAD